MYSNLDIAQQTRRYLNIYTVYCIHHKSIDVSIEVTKKLNCQNVSVQYWSFNIIILLLYLTQKKPFHR